MVLTGSLVGFQGSALKREFEAQLLLLHVVSVEELHMDQARSQQLSCSFGEAGRGWLSLINAGGSCPFIAENHCA